MGEKGSVRRLWRNLIEFLEEKRKGRPSLKSCFERGLSQYIIWLIEQVMSVLTKWIEEEEKKKSELYSRHFNPIRPILFLLYYRVASRSINELVE